MKKDGKNLIILFVTIAVVMLGFGIIIPIILWFILPGYPQFLAVAGISCSMLLGSGCYWLFSRYGWQDAGRISMIALSLLGILAVSLLLPMEL